MAENTAFNGTLPRSAMIAALGTDLEFDKEMAQYTTYGTGGAARCFLQANTVEDVVRAVKGARRLDLPFFVLGGGSNLLISDSGFGGLVIRLAVKGLEVVDQTSIACGAGEDLMALIRFATANSLTGLEFAAGIWGTVGGAIYGNAGAYGGEIGSVVTDVTLVDSKGNMKTVGREYCRFGYRDSYLKTTHEVAVKVTVRLSQGDRVAIEKKVEEILEHRRTKHPVTGKTAGCYFKNIPDVRETFGKLPAGRLLDEVGAKAMSVGGARVSDRHANFIMNCGGATSKDISDLADILKKRVYDKFGIELKEEVVRVGDF
jgi:UDP-N-acetylmuramate dehydrogenase